MGEAWVAMGGVVLRAAAPAEGVGHGGTSG